MDREILKDILILLAIAGIELLFLFFIIYSLTLLMWGRYMNNRDAEIKYVVDINSVEEMKEVDMVSKTLFTSLRIKYLLGKWNDEQQNNHK